VIGGFVDNSKCCFVDTKDLEPLMWFFNIQCRKCGRNSLHVSSTPSRDAVWSRLLERSHQCQYWSFGFCKWVSQKIPLLWGFLCKNGTWVF